MTAGPFDDFTREQYIKHLEAEFKAIYGVEPEGHDKVFIDLLIGTFDVVKMIAVRALLLPVLYERIEFLIESRIRG